MTNIKCLICSFSKMINIYLVIFLEILHILIKPKFSEFMLAEITTTGSVKVIFKKLKYKFCQCTEDFKYLNVCFWWFFFRMFFFSELKWNVILNGA